MPCLVSNSYCDCHVYQFVLLPRHTVAIGYHRTDDCNKPVILQYTATVAMGGVGGACSHQQHALWPLHSVTDNWLALPVSFKCGRRQRVYLRHALAMEHPATTAAFPGLLFLTVRI